jgi:hypothetical protein
MIVLRRVLAVALAAALALLFGPCIVLARTADAALDPGFAKQELLRVDAYDFVHEVLLPLAIDELLDEQEEWLPSNFEGVELPSEAEAQRMLLRLLRDVFPPEYLREQTEQAIDQFVPYLAGRTDAFELRFALDERVNAALGHPPGEPSAVEGAFRDLGLGGILIDGAIAQFEAEVRRSASASGLDEDAALREARRLIPDRDEAAEWFTAGLFAAIDELRPYLTGETDSLRTQIAFDEQTNLSPVLARLLTRSPEELQGEGFVFTDRDLNEALADGTPAPSGDLERQLDILRRGFVYTHIDFLEDTAPEHPSDVDAEDLRRWAGRIRGILRWGGTAIVAALVVAIGALGGRRWPTRVMWGAGALLVASAAWFAVFGPLYGGYAEPFLRDELLEATAGRSEHLAAARIEFVEKTVTVVGHFVGGMESRARLWLIVSTLAAAGATVWAHLSPAEGEPPAWWRRLRRRAFAGGTE